MHDTIDHVKLNLGQAMVTLSGQTYDDPDLLDEFSFKHKRQDVSAECLFLRLSDSSSIYLLLSLSVYFLPFLSFTQSSVSPFLSFIDSLFPISISLHPPLSRVYRRTTGVFFLRDIKFPTWTVASG